MTSLKKVLVTGAIWQAVEGINVVVHLGADPGDDGSWDSLLNNNVVGTYNNGLEFNAHRPHALA
ncbi:MAG: hypothetical protein AAF702_00735 [Chloroflexota bacterium]